MNRSQLSIEQEYALQQYEDGHNLLITGPGGTGKSFLIQQMIASSELHNKKYQVCAMTGCAAILLNCGATTIHSWSGIKIPRQSNAEIITNIKNNKKVAAKWRSTSILILDEVSMLSKKIFELLDGIGKAVRNNDKPFGGIQLIFTGDFYQLPPIGSLEDGSGCFCFESELWYKTFEPDNHIELKKLFRQTDPIYKTILNNVREGIILPENMEVLKQRLHVKYNKEENNGIVPTKLYAIKSKVDKINDMEFQKLEGRCYEYQCIHKSDCIGNLESGKPFSDDFIARTKKMLNQTKTEMEFRYLMENCPMERNLFLKKGANVMCTVNLDLENGICNGSVGIVEDFMLSGSFIPIVKFSNGVSRPIPVKYWQSEEFPTLALGQIPLKLAWAMTIHKSQGSTLSMGEIDIGNTVFECGQTYVALSRIQSLEGLYLCGLNPQKIKVNPKVKLFYSKIPKVEYDEEDEDEEKGEGDDENQNETLQEENYKEINLESFKYIHF